MDTRSVLAPDHLAALAEGDVRPLRRWLAEHLCQPGGPLPTPELDLLDDLAAWDSSQEQAKVRAAIEWALTAAAPIPSAAPGLLLYLKALFDRLWEDAWDVEAALDTIRFVRRRWTEIMADGPVADPSVAGLALQMIDLLAMEMATFEAGSAGTLATWARLARDTADRAERVLADAATCPASPVAELLTAEVRDDVVYYRALARAAQAVHDHFATGAGDVAGAVAALRAAEESLPDGIERSEMRSHRYGLESLAAAKERPWLRVEHGRIVYLYPFGLYEDVAGAGSGAVTGSGDVDQDGSSAGGPPPGAVHPAKELIEVARRTAADWTLAGCSVSEHPQALVADDLALTDIWKGDDPLGRQYRGMAIKLPDLQIRDPDREDGHQHLLEVEVRLSELGNHYLRISGDLSGATPPQVYAATLRAAPEFANLSQLGAPLRRAEAGPVSLAWRRLSDFAYQVICDLSEQLSRSLGRTVRRSGRPGMYHVMLAVDRASLVSPLTGTAAPVDTAREVLAAPGAQPLCHPVRDGISAVAEWLRYPVEAGRLPVVDVPGFVGDLVLRTCNTTLIMMLGSPDYMIRSMMASAEFVASLDGMFAGWQDQLADYHQSVTKQLAEMTGRLDQRRTSADLIPVGSAGYERAGRELMAMQAGLEAEQFRLHRFVMSSRTVLMFVTAPSLVTSPAIRLTIDRLLAAGRFGELRGEFEGMVEKVLADRIGALLEASVRRQQERADALARAERERDERAARLRAAREEEAAQQRAERERVIRRRIDILLGVMAAVGLSGLMQILQAGYDIRRAGTLLLIAVVVGLAVVVGWFLHWILTDKRSAKRRAAVSGPIDAAGKAGGRSG